IATPAGERRVEDLAAGDLVLTAAGESRPVLWIGRRSVAALFAEPLRSYPIRIAAGALDEAVPVRDLYVSPDHGLLVDGVLVQAAALVNGTTITRVNEPAPHFVHYHIELEDHALVLADGAVAETFVDNVTRRRFDNWAEYEALFGEREAHIAELELPRVKAARQLPRAIRERLTARAGALGGAVEKAA
ncbi:Hint domain-containing protein, partial [Chelatococcus reniformis]